MVRVSHLSGNPLGIQSQQRGAYHRAKTYAQKPPLSHFSHGVCSRQLALSSTGSGFHGFGDNRRAFLTFGYIMMGFAFGFI